MSNINKIDNILPFAHDKEDRKEVEEIAKDLDQDGGGIIVILCRDGKKIEFYHKSGYPVDFGDPTKSEEPVVYVRLSAATRLLRKAQQDWGPAMLAFWLHPDAGRQLPKYAQMTGARFPGCPTK